MDPLIGQISLFAFNIFVPLGWLKCDGGVYSIQQYQPLYALIGNTYGGTSGQTFAVPDLTGAEPDPNVIYCIACEGIFPERQ